MKLNIKRNEIWLFIILLPLIWPSAIGYFGLSRFTEILNGSEGLLLSFVLCIIWSRKIWKKIILNKIIIAINLMILIFICSTFLNGFYDYVEYCKVYTIVMILCISYLNAKYKGLEKKFLDMIIISKILVLIIGIILYVVYPKGFAITYMTAIDGSYNPVSEVYFWGSKNNIVHTFFPLIFFLMYEEECFELKKDGLNSRFSILITLILILLILLSIGTSTSTGTVVFSLSLFLYIFRNKKIIRSNLNGKIIGLGYLILTFILVVFQSKGIIAYLIANITHRTIGFTGRTTIWGAAMNMIKLSPLIGYGKDTLISHAGYFWYAHNLFLDLLMQGGIVALLIYCYIYCKAYCKRKVVFTSLYITLCVFMLMQIFESMLKSPAYMYLLFIIPQQYTTNRSFRNSDESNR